MRSGCRHGTEREREAYQKYFEKWFSVVVGFDDLLYTVQCGIITGINAQSQLKCEDDYFDPKQDP